VAPGGAKQAHAECGSSILRLEAQVARETSSIRFEIHKEKEMADFRKWLLLVAAAVLLLGSATTAHAQALTCTANAGVPPLIRAEGLAELVGDVVINCTGGTVGQNFTANWQIFLNTNITSRIVPAGALGCGGGDCTEALLLIDEPGAPGGSVLTPGVTAFRGRRAQDNSIVWLNVPFHPPGTTRTFRITNVRANANQLGVSSTLVPTQIVEFISVSGSQSVPLNNPQQTVGFVQVGLTFDTRGCAGNSINNTTNRDNTFLQCSSENSDLAGDSASTSNHVSQFGLRFREGFATAFKIRQAANQDPSTPGVVFNTESGFMNSVVLDGTAVNTGPTGLATQSSRLIARFNNVPAGVQIFVSTNEVGAGGDASSPLLNAQLVSANTLGEGGSAVSPTNSTGDCAGFLNIGAAPITLSGGSGSATWEITAADPFDIETALFDVWVAFRANTSNNLPGLGTANVVGSFAPISTVTTMSSSAPVPRFADVSTSRVAFTIDACVTNILFPFTTNQANFDTGIAISNTSRDIFGTATQAGTCQLNYFGNTTGGGAAPAAQTSATVAAGDHLVAALSSGGTHNIAATPGFQGYIIAKCFFQYGHGFAFISDLGAQRLAEGYLALVMDENIGSRTGSRSESLAH
jgi:hypothetical protein